MDEGIDYIWKALCK